MLKDTLSSSNTSVVQVFDGDLDRMSSGTSFTLSTFTMTPEGLSHGLGMRKGTSFFFAEAIFKEPTFYI